MDNCSKTAPDPAEISRRRQKRPWLRAVLYLALIYVVWCTVLYFYQDAIVFPADVAPASDTAFRLPRGRVDRLVLDLEEGGQVEGWFAPAPSASADTPAPVVFFCHGNAEIVDGQADVVHAYHRLGCSVFLIEYRGYGRSDGTPSEKGIVADAVRFYDEAVQRADVDRSRIVLHGRSLGGGVAAQLAARRKPAALILQSTFTSVADMAHGYLAPAFLARHPFRTDRILPALEVPVLIAHGSRDQLIPIRHARKLRDLASDITYIEYDCGHNNFPGQGNHQAYWNQVATFLVRAGVMK